MEKFGNKDVAAAEVTLKHPQHIKVGGASLCKTRRANYASSLRPRLTMKSPQNPVITAKASQQIKFLMSLINIQDDKVRLVRLCSVTDP